jgi:hypothetical protein
VSGVPKAIVWRESKPRDGKGKQGTRGTRGAEADKGRGDASQFSIWTPKVPSLPWAGWRISVITFHGDDRGATCATLGRMHRFRLLTTCSRVNCQIRSPLPQ